MIDPAPVRVGSWPIEWQRWFEQVRSAFAGTDATETTAATASANVAAVQSALTALQTALTQLEAEAGTTFETNSQLNGNQDNLNLIAGANMALTEDGNGNVTFSSAGGPLQSEVPEGVMDGVNKTFTVSHTPFELYLNGLLQEETLDITVSGATITYRIAPKASDGHRSYYTS